MIRIEDLKLAPGGEDGLEAAVRRRLGLTSAQTLRIRIVRRSLDARKSHAPVYIYVVDVETSAQKRLENRLRRDRGIRLYTEPEGYVFPKIQGWAEDVLRPIVVGFGPAGMFCALYLARSGLKPLVIEMGEPVEERVRTVERFWKEGRLNPTSNVQFGEGGAGTFSDGKLNTQIKDREGIGHLVLTDMVRAGAPEEILYENKPHIGTDRLRDMVRAVREEIRSLGGEIRFRTELTDLLFSDEGTLSGLCIRTETGEETLQADTVFLGIGHSARRTFEMLAQKKIPMERKAFAMGVRIEHLQRRIDEARYHAFAGSAGLPAADYKVTHRASNGRGVYSFCMCPGGYVVSAASEEGRLVTNGMSNYARDGRNANSALIVTVTPEDYEPYAAGADDVLSGMRMQRNLEEQAFLLGGGDWRAPVQRVGDFLLHRPSNSAGEVEPTFSCGSTFCDLHEILPAYMGLAIEEGIRAFGRSLPGFDNPDALLTGVESRTSSPVRILRDSVTGMSAFSGLYPIGEGAGYAGGIMSAAIDGIRAAQRYITRENGEHSTD